jgi:fatty-acyl-CoA synthase
MIDLLGNTARRATDEARSVLALVRAGVIGVEMPHTAVRVMKALNDYGPLGAAPRIAALRHGEFPAIADERGELTYDAFDEQVNRLANALRAKGLGPGSSLGILCRNHRTALLATFAASRGGMSAIWLNTSFSKRQAQEVAEREGVELLIHDVEYDDVVAGITLPKGALRVDIEADADEVDALIAEGDPTPPAPPSKPGRIVLLTSGTTGTPKGAPRPEPRSLTIPGAVLERMPMRARETTVIGPPLYHGTGLLIALLSISLGSKVVLRRKFNAAQFLDDIEHHGASTVCVVPVMLQRAVALGDEEIGKRDLSSLRVAFCAGSQLPSEVALRATEAFGDVIYNLYGSTEVSIATLATPEDVREAPTSVGKPALGVRIRILDPDGNQLPEGETGRIFVGTASPFEGYTGGGGKEIVDGLMATGDVGHFGQDGRLYIDGRDDDMIVSGGENVFPREVEDLLTDHEAVLEAAVLGVEDADFGQRLKAFVVLRDGAAVDEAALQAYVKDNLARFKVPREVVFMDELPRNPTGKVLKRELV